MTTTTCPMMKINDESDVQFMMPLSCTKKNHKTVLPNRTYHEGLSQVNEKPRHESIR